MQVTKLVKWLVCVIGAVLAFNSCADTFTREDIITDPDPARFNICYDNGCASLAWVTLSAEQWQRVKSAFPGLTASASDEREQIRTAIGLFETIVGDITGTSNDKGGNWAGFGLPKQMDCIDESTNTTIYLRMLQKYGLLHWHSVGDRVTRWGLFRWPHTTAIVEERATRQRWAVDSWFLDNGKPPFVLPLEVWKAGWTPFRHDAAEPPMPPQRQ